MYQGHRRRFQRKRRSDRDRWFVVMSGVSDSQINAVGIFLGDSDFGFFSKRAIQSLKGKLLGIRDRHLPGKRINILNLMASGEPNTLSLTVDRMVEDFRTQVAFKKKVLFHFCLNVEGPK